MRKPTSKIVIVDYGVGNLFSLEKAFHQFTEDIVISEDPEIILNASALILPGVGSFESGMSGLKVRNLVNPIKEFHISGKPMLGICLGAQLMLDKGYEFGEFDGLGLIPGRVIKFPESDVKDKIPHTGWNTVSLTSSSKDRDVFKALKKHPFVYFVHSYILVPEKNKHIFTRTVYGEYKFCSAIRDGNVYGFQFHPEKSGEVGLSLIKNFINLTQNYEKK